jgi:hypothetical protein
MTPQTLKRAREARTYFEGKAIEARQARDTPRLREVETRLAEVNDAIRKHYQDEAAAIAAAQADVDSAGRLF